MEILAAVYLVLLAISAILFYTITYPKNPIIYLIGIFITGSILFTVISTSFIMVEYTNNKKLLEKYKKKYPNEQFECKCCE